MPTWVNNPTPAAITWGGGPTGVTLSAWGRNLGISFGPSAVPVDNDIAGMLILCGTSSGLTYPDDLCYEGPIESTVFKNDATPSATYYIQVAVFDHFGKTGVIWSTENTVTGAYVQEADIGADEVANTHLQNDSVATAQIQSLAVTNDEINDMSVSKLTAGAIAAGQKIFVGTGTYNNTNTGFYVDADGKFSLGDQVTWDGTTFLVKGIVAPNGIALGDSNFLAANISAGDTSITLQDASSFPSSGVGYVDTDLFTWTGKTGDTLTGVPSSGATAIRSSHDKDSPVLLESGNAFAVSGTEQSVTAVFDNFPAATGPYDGYPTLSISNENATAVIDITLNSVGRTGLRSRNENGTGAQFTSFSGKGVHGVTVDGEGVYGIATGTGRAGYFNGDVHTTGTNTHAGQPAFLIQYNTVTQIAYLTTKDLTSSTEIFDRGSNVSSGVFTAPVTGLYQFNVVIRVDDLSVDKSLNLYLTTSNRTYTYREVSTTNSQYSHAFSVLADMDAGDTAKVRVWHNDTGNDVDIESYSYFSGYLVA